MYRVGTSGWVYDHWAHGVVYPRGLPRRAWLAHYASRFGTVELNGTFYRLPPRARFETWARSVPAEFVFAVKMSGYLTHRRRLREPAEPVARFLDASGGLGPHLGPTLLQLPPDLRVELGRLREVLDRWPRDRRLAVEPRHESWFGDEVLDLLAAHDVALCLADRRNRIPGPMVATASWGYVRLHEGTAARPPTGYGIRALRSWADRIRRLWPPPRDAYVYCNNDAGGVAVRDARTLGRLLDAQPSAGSNDG